VTICAFVDGFVGLEIIRCLIQTLFLDRYTMPTLYGSNESNTKWIIQWAFPPLLRRVSSKQIGAHLILLR
jgi:hypothetical protein